jgi:hypothetical protein
MMAAVLERGGDVHFKDRTGDTPADVAHMKVQRKMIAMLEARGAK